ncbi:Dabb family protein [Lentisphaera profundi]|uniref:Dabb family protein n=1 Tax=Lentisphaera profundi TaxID=1658616 RepID=A0ABY7W0Q9_9BACT|nr:Dabb family protein [Lentisphaera profundi]WDE98574.1 Dabb family protein [Lentisphaera profundi]
MYKVIIILMVVIMSSCSTLENQAKPQVQHIVMCWLKPGASQTEFIQAVKGLKKIEEVQNVSIGTKLESVEPVADNTFDISFIVTFKNNDDLKVYLDHPKHVEAVKTTLKPALAKVVVYDFQEL